MSADFHPLLTRNETFAGSGSYKGLTPLPRHQVMIVTCMDARVDPAHILGVGLGDALVYRNGGGRVTHDVLHEIAFIATVTDAMFGDQAPPFEVAILHHTGCGTGFLADDDFRGKLGARLTAGALAFDDAEVAAHAVIDPIETVRVDVQLVQSSAAIPDRVTVTGHVYDTDTGLVTSVS